MVFRFLDQLYNKDLSKKKLASIKKKLRRKKPKLRLFIITMPLGDEGLLEVYWYPELLQTYYQKEIREVYVVGVAMNREDAFQLISEIIAEHGMSKPIFSKKEFLKE